MDQEKRENQPILTVMTQEQINSIYSEAAAIGAREAIKKFEAEWKKHNSKTLDRRLRNTELLLRNYHMLKEHAENSVFGRTQMGESAADILDSMMNMYDSELIVESIRRSATRTAIMVSHIETMMGIYQICCERSSTPDIDLRRYEVLYDRYIADPILQIDEIAEKQNVSRDTVYSDLKVAKERLTALIFGVDGLNIH